MVIYKKLVKVTVARLRCLKNLSEDHIIVDKYTKEIEEIIREYCPHSGGIKCDFDFEKSTGEKLVINGIYRFCIYNEFYYEPNEAEKLIINNSHHYHMDDDDFYEGHISFVIIVTPSLLFDFKLKIKGLFDKNKSIKKYLYNLFLDSFNTLIG